MQLDIFKDKEFQDLDLEQKQKITTNYFNQELADDEFYKLSGDEQSNTIDNFIGQQIDIVDTKIDFNLSNLPEQVDIINSKNINNDNTTTREFSQNKDITISEDGMLEANQLNPIEQDEKILKENKEILFGDGGEYENPNAQSFNITKGIGERTGELVSNVAEFGQYIVDEVVGKDSKENTHFFDKVNDYVKDKSKLDYKPTHDWNEVKKAFNKGGVFDVDSWQEVGNYIVEQGIVSAPDMVAMVYQLPLYYFSRNQEMAETHAKNDGRDKPTSEDYATTAPFVMGTIVLDKFGLKGMTTDVVEQVGKDALEKSFNVVVKDIGTAVKNGVFKEGGTEFIQEGVIEPLGETIGTKKGASIDLERGFAGAVAGAGMGATLSGGVATVKSLQKYKLAPEKLDKLVTDAKKRTDENPLQQPIPPQEILESYKKVEELNPSLNDMDLTDNEKVKVYHGFEELFAEEIEADRQERLKTINNLNLQDFDGVKNHPLYELVIDNATTRNAKDIQSGKRLIQKGGFVKDEDRNGGEDNTIRWGNSYETNHDADFTLTKGDINNINKDNVTPEILEKIKQDITTYELSDTWAKDREDFLNSKKTALEKDNDGFKELENELFGDTKQDEDLTPKGFIDDELSKSITDTTIQNETEITTEEIPTEIITDNDTTVINNDAETQKVNIETTTNSKALSSNSYMKAQAIDSKIASFIKTTLQDNSKKNTKYDLGKIDDKTSKIIFEATGLKLKGFHRYIDSFGIKHILKEHGNKEIENARGQVPISLEDIASINDIVEHFDHVKKSTITDKNKKKRTRLVFDKKLDDGNVIYVEAVDFKNKGLTLKTMYKKSKAAADLTKDLPVTVPDSTLKGGEAGRSSDKSIAQTKPNSQDGTKITPNKSEPTNLYHKAGDSVGINYIGTYGSTGLPTRPKDDIINIGDRKIDLPDLEAPTNADSLRVYLSDIIGGGLYDSKIKNKSALGVYKRNDSAIRVKNHSNIEVMAHELAHYLDFFHKNKTKKAIDSFFRSAIMKNKDEVKSVSYTNNPKLALSEGFAEFVRLWLTNYNAIDQVAPNMVRDFEARLKTDKKLYDKMITLQDGMHSYYFQGANVMLRSRRGGELDSTAKKIQRTQSEIGRDIRQKAIDKLHTIKRIEADILGDIPDDTMNSAYKSLQMVNGHSSIMFSTMNNGVPLIKENGDITYAGKSLNEIFKPATKVSEARVKLLEDYLVAKRASELKEQGRENLITDEEIRAGLKLVEQHPEFETIFNDYQDFNDGMLDFYVDMKLITTSQRENFKEFNKNYVPFHRITESVQYGTVPPSKIGQRLTGGTHSLGNIMENIIDGIESNIKEALISRGKSVFYEMLERSGAGGVYATRVGTESKLVKADINKQAKNMAQIMAQLGITVSKNGQIISGDISSDQIIDINEIEENLLLNPTALEFFTHGHKPSSKTGYIDSAIIDDKIVYFETNDIGLVDAITSFRSNHYNKVVQGLMTVKNVMTWNIVNNPLFYLANFAKDTISAGVLSKNNFLPVVSSIKGMYHFITNSTTYKEFMASGSGYGTRRTTVGGDIQAMQMLEVNRKWDLLGTLISGMEYVADVFEYGTRVGDFSLAKQQGKSNWQSGYEAREVSTDYAIKGSHQALSGFLATVPFMKAGINGIDKTTRRIFSLSGEMKFSNGVKFTNQLGELQKHKIKIYATGGMMMAGTLALFMKNKDDERYKNLTKDQKLMYWNFFLEDGSHIKIPRPYDIGFIFSAIPELIAHGIYTKNGEDALKDFVWSIKTMFSVGDISGFFQPIIEDMTNKNWTGSPVVPTYMQNLDDKSEQYMESTPLLYREFGKATGVSPIKTQHYIDGCLGLTAKMIEEATENMLWNKKEWGARPFAKNPVEFLIYRFKGKEVEPRTIWSEKYYELVKKANGIKSSFDAKRRRAFKDGGTDTKEYMSKIENQAYTNISGQLRRYNKLLTTIKTSIEVISYDPKITRANKEKKINEAYKIRTDIFEKLVTGIEDKIKVLGE